MSNPARMKLADIEVGMRLRDSFHPTDDRFIATVTAIKPAYFEYDLDACVPNYPRVGDMLLSKGHSANAFDGEVFYVPA